MGSVISFFRVVRSGIEPRGTLDGYPYGCSFRIERSGKFERSVVCVLNAAGTGIWELTCVFQHMVRALVCTGL